MTIATLTRGSLMMYRWHRREALRLLRLSRDGVRPTQARVYAKLAVGHLADARAILGSK